MSEVGLKYLPQFCWKREELSVHVLKNLKKVLINGSTIYTFQMSRLIKEDWDK